MGRLVMRRADKIVLLVALAVPLALVLFGWPLAVRWATQPPAPTPEVAAAQATPVAAAEATRSARTPTVGAPRVIVQPAVQETPVPESATSAAPDEPGLAVARFYELVAQHDFERAGALWTPRMRAAFPPDENINQRFSQTRGMQVQHVDVVSQDPAAGRATVAVDVVETLNGRQQRFVGTWQLARGADGWLLDQPDLQLAR